MGQGACSGYLKQDLQATAYKKSSRQADDLSDSNNNSNDRKEDIKAMELQKIAALEEQLRQKDAEIQGLQVK